MKYLSNYKTKVSDQCEWLLYALVFTLVFEGIVRKLFPGLSTPVFFLKDVLCIIGLYLINRLNLTDIIAKLKFLWLRLFILFLPLLFFTAFKDPLLAVFAAKQYLLYLVAGILVSISFPDCKEERFRIFIFLTAFLLIPTTLVAIIQNGLPATHWLNLSVEGESLERFAAGGYLRVSSTFSFTGQYSWFLNAESFFLATSFFMPPDFKFGLRKQFQPLVYIVLVLMLVIGAFITGGRTAVLGCGATLILGFFFIGMKRPGWVFSKGVLIILLCIISLSVLRQAEPQFFMAYDERSSGYEDRSHNEEITDRILGGFTDWTDWFWHQDAASVLLGNGLGIMSNGSSQISSYALGIRADGFWTEGDVPTTFWEGGLYLGLIWYGFRLSLILLSYRLWRAIKNKVLASAASVPLAYVVIHGLIAQFGIQPPLSIWWWLAIGIIIFMYRFEKYNPSFSPIIKEEQQYKEKNHVY